MSVQLALCLHAGQQVRAPRRAQAASIGLQKQEETHENW
jgi:hypothetical protein